MKRRSPIRLIVVLLLLFVPAAAESGIGRIDGRVTDTDGGGRGGVAVTIEATGRTTLTGGEGAYSFSDVPSGTYDLVFVCEGNSLNEKGIVVTPGQTANVDATVTWGVARAEAVTVYAASRRVERVVDAPTAVAVVGSKEIDRQAGHGQLPKLLEFLPGAEVTQSGLYDYNLNTRGFNGSLNRRVATLIDGRDPSVPFLGAQEWAALSFPLDDLAGAEFLRGPGAALYGKNATGGVLSLTTRQPRFSEGGTLRLTGGELSTTNLDFRWAGHVFNDWYVKAVAGSHSSADFSRSRDGVAEYATPCTTMGQTDCLPQEVPLARVHDNEIRYAGVRVDKYWGNGATLTVEGGTADIAGPVFQSGIGRVQLLDVKRPWARVRWADDHWDVQAQYTRRDAPRQLVLETGLNLALDGKRVGLEVRRRWSLAADRLRLVAGGSRLTEDLDSFDPSVGQQSLPFAPVDGNFSALFGQAGYRFSETFEGILAARWDDSSLHASRVSPRAALVWKPAPNQSLRLTYNEAFQVGSDSQLLLQAPLNGNLDLERVRSWELGWSAVFSGVTSVTVDYYRCRHDPFLGNSGNVDTQGVDVSMNHFVGGAWIFQSSYSWFDHENAQAADLPSPNSPEHKAAAGIRYSEGRFDGELLLRWTDDFRWADGPFQGDVPAYATVDLNANYRIGDAWKAGIAIANLFDNGHYESFGGDLLGRRALGHVTFLW